ncbi:unnamed protein product [Rhodiola kirilowii]
MDIDPEWKMINRDEGRIEKWILRRAFDDEENPYLPKHILYRQKEQFSDGVGYSWIDGLKSHAAQHVTDKMMLNASHIFPHNTPNTKEAYYYRMIFERYFPQNSARLTVPGEQVLLAAQPELWSGMHLGLRTLTHLEGLPWESIYLPMISST